MRRYIYIYIYIRKTKRDLETRVKEHFKNLKNGKIENQQQQHMYGKENMQQIVKPILLMQTLNKQGLTNWDNILIPKNKDCIINFEIPPVDYLTKKLILNPVGSSRSTPTRIPNQHKSVMG